MIWIGTPFSSKNLVMAARVPEPGSRKTKACLPSSFTGIPCLPASGWAKVFKVFLKQDGSLGHVDRTDAATAGQFQALLRHTRRQLGALADGVLDGDVAVSPYRLRDFSPCQWCDMRAVCRFEFGDPGMRHLEALKRGEVLDRVEGEG